MSKSRNREKQENSRSQAWVAYAGIGLVVVLVVAVLIGLGRPSQVALEGEVGPDASIYRGETDDGFHYLGEEEAPVTLRVFEDYACPNCKDFMTNVEQQILDEYVIRGDVRLVIYTMAYVGPQSLPAAEALYCADEQGQFWEYRQLLFVNQGRLVFQRDNLLLMGETLGLDTEKLATCFDQARYREVILERTRAAQKFGVVGTPTIETAGVRYEGARPFLSNNPEVIGVDEIIGKALAEATE